MTATARVRWIRSPQQILSGNAMPTSIDTLRSR